MSTTLDLATAGTPDTATAVPAPGLARPSRQRQPAGTPAPAGFTRVLQRTGKVLSTVLVVLAIAAFALLALGPRLLGYQTSTMLTGSMAPLINPGDVVVTVPVPVKDIRVGDIITYHIPVEDQRVETHRIIEITTTPTGQTAVQTKGDANNGKDPWVATLSGQMVDRQVATIPYLGTAIRTLREPAVRNTLMYGAPAVLVLGLLTSIWRKDPKHPDADTSGTGQAQASSRA